MSSPPPDAPRSPEHTYQTSDSNDLTSQHSHKCHCADKTNTPKTETRHGHVHSSAKTAHHHNIISHVPNTTNHIHPITLQSSPKIDLQSKIVSNTCTCHLQDESQVKDEGENNHRKFESDDRIEISPLPPALPPRPPPRPRFDVTNARYRGRISNSVGGESKKYIFWCTICGGLITTLGALFLTVYFLLRSLTSTLNYFETVPTFVPATMLIMTGVLILILSRRKYRNNYLIKVGGLCCLLCALTCVLVTITTTVIHMNRLQTLRECVYTKKTRTCTCYSVLLEAHSTADDGVRYVFDATPDCEVIHGELYTCLRTMFGISVSGILVCIFSCMLMYQLLSHEKKKMYWEQLELRCRSFYQQHTSGPASNHGSVREPSIPSTIYCSCCEECRYPSLPIGPQVYPWDTHHSTDRFWTPGRVGNFYSPNPGDVPQVPEDPQNRNRSACGWNWRRLPWTRGNGSQSNTSRDSSLVYQGVVSSADSQYGFGTRALADNQIPRNQLSEATDSYSVLDNRPPIGGVYIWGPPPPYSNPNSPARRIFHSPARYQHVHHHAHSHESHCQMNEDNQFRASRRTRQYVPNKENYENTTETEVHQHNEGNESTDTSSCADRISHTLPVRKVKKRTDMASVKSINQASSNKVNVQNIFMQNNSENHQDEDRSYHEPNLQEIDKTKSDVQQCRFLPRLQGVENAAFQKQESSPQKPDSAESEVYFADVSSCCNISVRNDGQDSSLYDEALENKKSRNDSQLIQSFQESISSSTVAEDEDYLAHRMGNRQMSTRSRMPIPLPSSEDLVYPNESCLQLLPKDLSQNSLCSSIQTPVTETTDDAITPIDCCSNYFPDQILESPSRKFPKTDQFLAPDAQYEVVQDKEDFIQNPSNLTSTISGLSNYNQNYYSQNKNNFSYNALSKNIPPKSLNLNQCPSRKNIGSNISSIIQNLGGNPVGLLYGEVSAGEEENQGQGCHSDGTMDSGWQSGSEKHIDNKKSDNCELSS